MSRKEAHVGLWEYPGREAHEWKKVLGSPVEVPELPSYLNRDMLQNIQAAGLEPFYVPPIALDEASGVNTSRGHALQRAYPNIEQNAQRARYLRLLQQLEREDYVSSPPQVGEWVLTTDKRHLMPAAPLTRYLNRWPTAYYEDIDGSTESKVLYDHLSSVIKQAGLADLQMSLSVPTAVEHLLLVQLRKELTAAAAEWTRTKVYRKSASPGFVYKDESGAHVGRIFDHHYLAVRNGSLVHEPGRFMRYHQEVMDANNPESTPIRIRPLIHIPQ